MSEQAEAVRVSPIEEVRENAVRQALEASRIGNVEDAQLWLMVAERAERMGRGLI